MAKRIAIVGCRPPRTGDVQDLYLYRALCTSAYEFACALPEGTIIVSGGADGIDKTAALAAKRYPGRLLLEEHLPDYKRFSPARAPLARNIIIAERCDEMHAWPAPWSRGTWHAVNEARKREKPTHIHELSTQLESAAEEKK